jgi:hypothetical protein
VACSTSFSSISSQLISQRFGTSLLFLPHTTTSKSHSIDSHTHAFINMFQFVAHPSSSPFHHQLSPSPSPSTPTEWEIYDQRRSAYEHQLLAQRQLERRQVEAAAIAERRRVAEVQQARARQAAMRVEQERMYRLARAAEQEEIRQYREAVLRRQREEEQVRQSAAEEEQGDGIHFESFNNLLQHLFAGQVEQQRPQQPSTVTPPVVPTPIASTSVPPPTPRQDNHSHADVEHPFDQFLRFLAGQHPQQQPPREEPVAPTPSTPAAAPEAPIDTKVAIVPPVDTPTPTATTPTATTLDATPSPIVDAPTLAPTLDTPTIEAPSIDTSVPAAPSTLDALYESHSIRNEKLSTLASLTTSLASHRSSFTFPSTLDFTPLATVDPVDPVAPTRSPKLAFSSTNVPFLAYEDFLVGLLSKADEIQSAGDMVVRRGRKELVRAVEKELRALDEGREAVWRRLIGEKESDGEKGADGGEYLDQFEMLDLVLTFDCSLDLAIAPLIDDANTPVDTSTTLVDSNTPIDAPSTTITSKPELTPTALTPAALANVPYHRPHHRHPSSDGASSSGSEATLLHDEIIDQVLRAAEKLGAEVREMEEFVVV